MSLKESNKNNTSDEDPNATQRKEDHIKLAFESVVPITALDQRFIYEPMLAGHDDGNTEWPFEIAGKKMRFPIWVSSMTGGTDRAKNINFNLAQVCNDFGLGMGLGSCRQLLHSDDRFNEFDIRKTIGNQPLFINIGIAQLEQSIQNNTTDQINQLTERLQADGIIIHVNPLQEWMQPEGDMILYPPIDTITTFLSKTDYPVIVKEVGQGMGKSSLKALLLLPLEAIELAANGGTNFSKLELLRLDDQTKENYQQIVNIGHSAHQMIKWCNELYEEMGDERKCNKLIISGGVKGFLDGYYLMSLSKIPAIFAMASGFLKYALDDYEKLRQFATLQTKGLMMSKKLFKINPNYQPR